MQNFTTKTIREIAVEMPASTRVFEEFKIDFCCGGGRRFDEACQRAGIEPELVSRKINEALTKQTRLAAAAAANDVAEQKSLSGLIDHILETHHVFTKREIIRLGALMEKVRRKHGDAHPELYFLENEFFALCADLTPHLRKEENVLFPFIKHLEMSATRNLSTPRPPFGTVKNPVRMMMTEHDTAGDILRKMREAAKDYVVPEGACPSFRALYFGFEELEKDLHQHIHLENNVLFPRAVALEQKVIFGY
jgi:regulator of cell morphogenesis and NO signaling